MVWPGVAFKYAEATGTTRARGLAKKVDTCGLIANGKKHLPLATSLGTWVIYLREGDTGVNHPGRLLVLVSISHNRCNIGTSLLFFQAVIRKKVYKDMVKYVQPSVICCPDYFVSCYVYL